MYLWHGANGVALHKGLLAAVLLLVRCDIPIAADSSHDRASPSKQRNRPDRKDVRYGNLIYWHTLSLRRVGKHRLRSMKAPRQINIRAIHDLERAIRVWELARDTVQQAVNEKTASYGKLGGDVETEPAVAEARAYIARCNSAILGAKVRIDELEGGDQSDAASSD